MNIIQRLRNPPLGTETSERNLMAQAAAEIELLKERNEKLLGLLSEVAASMQISPLRMELRGRIKTALQRAGDSKYTDIISDGGMDPRDRPENNHD